jgi:catechol 2,3-dioxygenase-like lactoylglutathione lyase family enzyme
MLGSSEIMGRHISGDREMASGLFSALSDETPIFPTRATAERSMTVTVRLNHTIIAAHDKEKASLFLTGILGLPAPSLLGPFAVVPVGDGTSLDFMDTDGEIESQHYAFLVDENEFDEIFGRIRDRHLPYWADPYRHKRDEINTWDGGRGVYFDDPSGHLLEIITRPYGSGGTTTSQPHPLFAQPLSPEDHEDRLSDQQAKRG